MSWPDVLHSVPPPADVTPFRQRHDCPTGVHQLPQCPPSRLRLPTQCRPRVPFIDFPPARCPVDFPPSAMLRQSACRSSPDAGPASTAQRHVSFFAFSKGMIALPERASLPSALPLVLPSSCSFSEMSVPAKAPPCSSAVVPSRRRFVSGPPPPDISPESPTTFSRPPPCSLKRFRVQRAHVASFRVCS